MTQYDRTSSLVSLVRMTVEAEKSHARLRGKGPRRAAHTPPPASPPDRRPPPPSQQPLGPALAKAIVRAGEIRRGEIDDTPKPNGLAAKIIEAGRKRRGEI